MAGYSIKSMKEALAGNAYPGRGIVIGKSADGKKAVFAYFITGRSANSRNRIFTEHGDELRTEPFDESKVEDPSLIIYSPVKVVGKKIIVTNGDQTDTIEAGLKAGRCFRHALKSRAFEPDAPNFTPRISGILDLEGEECGRRGFGVQPLHLRLRADRGAGAFPSHVRNGRQSASHLRGRAGARAHSGRLEGVCRRDLEQSR